MTVQAVEVTSVGEVPNNGYGSTCGLRISESEVSDSFYNAEHAFTDKRVFEQPFCCAVINSETEEQQTNQRR